MRKLLTVLLFLPLMLTLNAQPQQVFQRHSIIPTVQYEPGGGGFGGFVSGVDFDNDGIPEIYACNTNMIDRDGELIPKVWKFEWNEATATWDSVWGAVPGIPLQNTWPAFTWGDLDADGKPEIIWSPANYLDASTNPNPWRVIVYEVVGDGSDNLGVDDGFGSFLPNSTFTITQDDNFDLRPVKSLVMDIDNDGIDELIFADRSSSANYSYGVLSVDDIPDLGGGSETWTIEASGFGDPILAGTGPKWDIAVVGSVLYLFAQSGSVFPVKYDTGTWTALNPQSGIANGSFKGSATVDIDNDGTDEIVVAGWLGNNVYLLQQDGDTLISTQIADLASIGAGRFLAAASGDLDDDGNPDFVFGTRGDPPSVPNNAVFRMEYQGGSITDSASYQFSVIDSFLVPEPDGLGGDLDVVYVMNVDGDVAHEVIYTQGYTRGIANDTTADVAILDIQHTPVSVELADDNIPDQYYLDQNFPNPFNPATTIKFGLTTEMAVELKVFDITGQEVMTLIDGQLMNAGSYNVHLDASSLASGTYIYRLKAGNYVESKKMMLIK
jgi:hypothetical protein